MVSRTVQPHVLIVDDDTHASAALSQLLRHHGYDVDYAETVQNALAKIEGGPEFLVLDLNLPDGVGVTVLHYIRDRGLDTQVAVTTGTTDDSLRSAALQLKPGAFFLKPLDPDELVGWLSVSTNG